MKESLYQDQFHLARQTLTFRAVSPSIPFTTIQKAFGRPATTIWRALLKLAPYFPRGKLSGIDASGYERNCELRAMLQRNLGSVNEVGRTYGGWVGSRVWGRQFRKIVAKHVVYNIDRALKFLIIFLALFLNAIKGGFLQSPVSLFAFCML